MENQKQSIIWTILGRILAFPFFFGIALVGALIIFLKWIVNYVRFGGESIAYTRKTDRKTIHDVFIKVTGIDNENKTAINEIENAMERWHHARDNDNETIEKINEIMVSIGKLEWFNKKPSK